MSDKEETDVKDSDTQEAVQIEETEEEAQIAKKEAGADPSSSEEKTSEEVADSEGEATTEAETEADVADEKAEVKAEEEALAEESASEADQDDDDSDTDENEEGWGIPDSERRQSGRKGVKLSRLISSKIVDGESERECYLHLVDISEGGLRINSDDPFPEERNFVLEIGLAPFGNELATKSPKHAFPVRTVWSKSLVGGMVVSGLAFQELDDAGQEVVSAIMKGASPQGRRLHFRLNRVLGVELGRENEEEQQWLYPLTLDLSVEGMRICLNEPLEVGSKFPIKVFLEFELPTVQAEAEVMWQETMPSGRVQVGLKFEDISDRDAMAIKTYIDQCLQQDEAHRRL